MVEAALRCMRCHLFRHWHGDGERRQQTCVHDGMIIGYKATMLNRQQQQQCELIPFPAVRRVGLIRKLARLMASYSVEGGERALSARLNAQYIAMLRRGVRPRVIKRELEALERAIRIELTTIMMRGGNDDAA
jgi:hypothetical protein